MTRRLIILIGGLIFTTGLVVFGDQTPVSAVVESASRGPKRVGSNTSRSDVSNSSSTAHLVPPAPSPGSAQHRPSSEVLVLQIAPREKADASAAEGAPGSLFISQTWVPPPPPPPPPEKPTAPPLPFSFLGKQQERGVWTVFLNRDGNTFVVKEGDLVEADYQVVAITPPTMTFRYVPLNEAQSLTIE